MKRLLCLFCCLFYMNTFSQDMTTKKGEVILPEQGDWSIGTTVHPLSNFIFNLLSDSPTRDDDVPSFGDDLYFYMKKFTSPARAVRYTFGANFNMDDETWSMGLGYGVERRKGNTRLQGMWGYQGFFGVSDTFDSADLLSIPNAIYEDDYSMNVHVGVFIGCEYFILAKIAIGAEYHYGCTFSVHDNESSFNVGGNANTTTMKINFYF
jgi:hypothetical protein